MNRKLGKIDAILDELGITEDIKRELGERGRLREKRIGDLEREDALFYYLCFFRGLRMRMGVPTSSGVGLPSWYPSGDPDVVAEGRVAGPGGV